MQATSRTHPDDVYVGRQVKARRDVERWAPLVGRVLIASIFVVSGLAKIADFGGTLAYMDGKGIPAPSVLLVAAIMIEVGAGLALVFGLWTRLSSLLLAAYLIPVTLIFHDFWAYTGTEQVMQMASFLKNLAIMGGLVYIATYGAGLLGLDERRRRRELARGPVLTRPFSRQPVGT